MVENSPNAAIVNQEFISQADTVSSVIVENPVEQPALPEQDWHAMVQHLNLQGMGLQLAEHCVLAVLTTQNVNLLLQKEAENLKTQLAEASLKQAIEQYLGHSIQLNFTVGEFNHETPGQRRVRNTKKAQALAEQAIVQDPFVKALQQRFGAVLIQDSIQARTQPEK